MRMQVCKIAGGDCAVQASPTRALARAARKPPKETFHGVPLMPTPPALPPGDGGLAYGQAAIAAANDRSRP